MPLRASQSKFGVPIMTISNHLHNFTVKDHGGQIVFSREEEDKIVKYLELLSDWGQPLTLFKLRMIGKRVLDKQQRTVPKFKDSFPGVDGTRLFLNRHKERLVGRNSRLITSKRGEITQDETNL